MLIQDACEVQAWFAKFAEVLENNVSQLFGTAPVDMNTLLPVTLENDARDYISRCTN